MKFLVSQLLYLLSDRPSRVNLFALLRFLVLLLAMITIYSVLFHYLMGYEGRQESWITGFYWTLTVMSTLLVTDAKSSLLLSSMPYAHLLAIG